MKDCEHNKLELIKDWKDNIEIEHNDVLLPFVCKNCNLKLFKVYNFLYYIDKDGDRIM